MSRLDKYKSESYNTVRDMKTLAYILSKYNLKKNKPQHKLYCSREGSLSVLFKELGFNLGAVIGVNTGMFSKILFINNLQLKLYAVAPEEGSDDALFNKAKARLGSFNCQLIRNTSVNAAKMFTDKSLDFIYLDSFPDYKKAAEDIKEWSKKVKKGGIISGNLYSDGLHGQPAGVKTAVNKWVKKNKIKSLFVFEKNIPPTWFYVKG